MVLASLSSTNQSLVPYAFQHIQETRSHIGYFRPESKRLQNKKVENNIKHK